MGLRELTLGNGRRKGSGTSWHYCLVIDEQIWVGSATDGWILLPDCCSRRLETRRIATNVPLVCSMRDRNRLVCRLHITYGALYEKLSPTQNSLFSIAKITSLSLLMLGNGT